jgi:hypothetical protein
MFIATKYPYRKEPRGGSMIIEYYFQVLKFNTED